MSNVSTKMEGFRKIAVPAMIILVVLALLAWGLSALVGGKSKQSPRPPRITLLAPPPPPPPPPPKIEKQPDPPKEIKEPPPKQPAPDPAPQLKMEGPAGNGDSAFAAGKVTNDLSKGMFNPFNNYANMLRGDLHRYFNKNTDLRRRRYTVELSVWVAGGGEIKRFELIGGTGDSDTDAAIKKAMSSLASFKQAPPANMPQPIRLRIVTTG